MNKWERRDSKEQSKRRFKHDNRKSVRWMFSRAIEVAKHIKMKRD